MRHAALLLLLACSVGAGAETLRGVVRNGTTRKVSAGDEVTLKRAGNGMEDVAKTTSNAKGEFSFEAPPAQMPYVISVKHQSVAYIQAAAPGPNPAAIQVFDTATKVKNINLQQRMMVLQTVGTKLRVNELYTVENGSVPPRTKTGQRTLEIYVPGGATIEEAGARPNGLMPLKIAVVPQAEKNRYAFTYPIRPGDTQLTITYTLPYNGQLKINPRVTQATAQLMLVVPNPMSLVPEDRSLFVRASDPQIKNVNVFVASDVTPQQKLGFEIQGSGTLARAQKEGQATATSPESAAETSPPGDGAGPPSQRREGTHSPQWVFLAVLFMFLAAGATYVYAANHAAPHAPALQLSPSLLEAIREEMFQLESDRLLGKLSAQEYAAAKAALDKTMRSAVQRTKSS